MKTIGFIGAYDKTDFILNIAKTLAEFERTVLVVDTTALGKLKYVVPTISPTKSYMTNFEKIDFAFGFENLQEILKYLGLEQQEGKNAMPYDYMLIDIDNGNNFEKFDLKKADANYFVTAFDLYSLRRGINIIEEIKTPIRLTKVLFSYEISKSDEDYLEFISQEKNVIWNDYTIYFTILKEDNQAMEENERVAQIRLKRLSNEYKESLATIVQDIIKDINVNKVKKMIKG